MLQNYPFSIVRMFIDKDNNNSTDLISSKRLNFEIVGLQAFGSRNLNVIL